DAEYHPEPDQIDAKSLGGRSEQRDNDEGELEEIEKEREQEHEGVDEYQEADLSARQADQHLLDPPVAADAVEREREHSRADQDEDHEGRQLCRRFRGLPYQVPGQPSLHRGQRQRAGRPHGAAFGRGCDTDEYGPEYEEDQRKRRHHHEYDLLGQHRDQAKAKLPPDRSG